MQRILHISITNPDIGSDLPYFRGKAQLESCLQSLNISYCILRPTVIFGKDDVLINNIAWTLRHLPLFGIFGSGNYRLQPIHVEDLAHAVVDRIGGQSKEIVQANGPETFTYCKLVEAVRSALGVTCPIISVPPSVGYWTGRLLGIFVRDVIVTREEIRGLMEERLYVDAPPLGTTRLTEWIHQHRDTLGRRYTSEMARRVDRTTSYQSK